MKKNTLKRIVCMCLLATLLMNSAAMTAKASSDSVIMPRWTNTSEAATVLSFSGTTANCSTAVYGYSSVKEIYGTMILKRISGTTETTVKSWSVSSDGRDLLVGRSCTVTKGYKYKLMFNGYVCTDSYSEYISTSSSGTCN